MVVSHTLVRNGMPFIEPVLKQVEPFMDKMLVTISEKSTDGTRDVLADLQSEWKGKLIVSTENVDDPALLTWERQKQIEKTPENAWVLFLDDDDWWPEETLGEIIGMLDENNFDAIAPSPLQVIDKRFYDKHWYENKFFTKWFRNIDINYHNPWPRDIIKSGDKELYWKKNLGTKRLKGKYFHLSWIKPSTFRNEAWSKGHYVEPIKNVSEYPKWCKPYIEKIWTYL